MNEALEASVRIFSENCFMAPFGHHLSSQMRKCINCLYHCVIVILCFLVIFTYWQKQEVCIDSVDFTAALHHVRPSVQHSSDLFLTNMPHISWDDIGGLEDVKEKLKQVLFSTNSELLPSQITL